MSLAHYMTCVQNYSPMPVSSQSWSVVSSFLRPNDKTLIIHKQGLVLRKVGELLDPHAAGKFARADSTSSEKGVRLAQMVQVGPGDTAIEVPHEVSSCYGGKAKAYFIIQNPNF